MSSSARPPLHEAAATRVRWDDVGGVDLPFLDCSDLASEDGEVAAVEEGQIDPSDVVPANTCRRRLVERRSY